MAAAVIVARKAPVNKVGVHIHAQVHMSTCTRAYTHTYKCMHTCLYTYTCTGLCAYFHMYKSLHTHIQVHAHMFVGNSHAFTTPTKAAVGTRRGQWVHVCVCVSLLAGGLCV